MGAKDRFTVRFAVYLILRNGKNILMLRRQNSGHEDGNYGLIQGHVDGGETAQQAIVREAKEEAGIEVSPRDLRVVHVEHSPADDASTEYICVYLETSKWKGEPHNTEPEKCSDMRWFPESNLPDNTIGYIRDMLDDVRRGAFYSNRGWSK